VSVLDGAPDSAIVFDDGHGGGVPLAFGDDFWVGPGFSGVGGFADDDIAVVFVGS